MKVRSVPGGGGCGIVGIGWEKLSLCFDIALGIHGGAQCRFIAVEDVDDRNDVMRG